MQVIATAGHVDHGKSTLVRALTGMEPDRWAEERRRGMTIDLGYAWTRLPSGEQIAFVDVPGHERFTTNMLAGVGPVPVVLLVVAADEGWAAQTAEHVRALDCLGVRRGLVAVTKSDLADPGPAMADTLRRLGTTSLAGIGAVAVSGETGEGLGDLLAALESVVSGLPPVDPAARVRLWVDRSFTIRGAGTVVTGTLGAGTVRRGDTLELRGSRVGVRGVERLGEPADWVAAPARVAVNLRGVDHREVRRGDALLSPGAWLATPVVDVRADGGTLPSRLVLHIGAAAVPVSVRPLTGGGDLVRLSLDVPLPLAVGDRALLREPGRRQVITGVTVLDPSPPPLRRRGAARARAAALAGADGTPDLVAELSRRGAASRALLAAIGVPIPDPPPQGVVAEGGWLVDAPVWAAWRAGLTAAVDASRADQLLASGVPRDQLAQRLSLPDPDLLAPLLRAAPELEEVSGRVRRRRAGSELRPDLAAAVARLTEALSRQPFAAPEAAELVALGLGPRELGAAAAARLILRLPGDVVLLPTAAAQAMGRLRDLEQPFSLSAAREALETTRRVAVPLLEHLDRLGLTERVDQVSRRVRTGR
jgi:selenocysteine-specific elongation factor